MNIGDMTIFGLPLGSEPVGIHFRNHGSMQGVATVRRNPKRKNRLPYHARKQLSLPVITDPKARTCPHALSAHEFKNWPYLDENDNRRERLQVISYAHGCISKHSSKKVQHRDVTGRKW